MPGKILKMGSGTPGGSDKQVQFRDGSAFAGCAQLYWDKANNRLGIGDSTPARQLSLTKCIELLTTTTSGIGVIYKGANRFMHDFHHPTGGGAIPTGLNLFVGEKAGNFTTGSGATSSVHGSYNVGLGYQSLYNLAKGYGNMGVGYNTLVSLTDGFFNMGIGTEAAYGITVGDENCAIGRRSLRYNVIGNRNTAIGSEAIVSASGISVSNNVAIGYKAGALLNTGGDNNILIGYQAGDNITTGEKNIIIGYDLNALAAAGDNQLNIASLIFGDLGATKKVGINTSTLNETLNVGGAIRLGTSALTNAGTIRWSGSDFEGYNGGWISLTDGDFSNGGESTGANRSLGNSDNYGLAIETNNLTRMWFNNDGSIGINKTTSLGTKLDIDGNFRSWYTKAGSAVMEVCGTHRMLITGSSLASDFFASWAINVGPTSSGATRNVVGMEINVQESESDQGIKASRTGKSSTILQIVPESTFDTRSGYNVSFGIMLSRGSHTGNPRMHVGIVAEQFAIVHQGAFMLLHGGNGAGDQPNAAMDLRDNWLCGVDTSAATLSYAFKTKNNQPFVSRNAADNATKELIKLASDNQVQVGRSAVHYVNLGQSSAVANPVRIRVGGVNDKDVQAGAVDTGGTGFRMLIVAN